MFLNWDNDQSCLQCGGVVVVQKPLHVPQKMRLKGEQRYRPHKAKVYRSPTKTMLEVASALEEGLNLSMIAQQRGVARTTVKGLVGDLFKRLGVPRRRGVPAEITYRSWLQSKGD